MFNEMIVVSVAPFRGTTSTDKNGEQSVILLLAAGRMPNRNVLSGTVAKNIGIEIGKSYLMQVREQGFDKFFGPDFTFIKMKELETGKDIIESCAGLSEPELVTIEKPKEFQEQYHRKGDAVEGIRTERIKSGDYVPAHNTTATDHESARDVKKGSSQESLDNIPSTKKSDKLDS